MQHTPSTAKPEAHGAPLVAGVPSASLHSPKLEQLLPSRAAQVSASSVLSTGAQRPGLVPAHVSHAAHAGALQHTPSVQNAVSMQSAEVAHEPPSVPCTHVSLLRPSTFDTPPKSTSSPRLASNAAPWLMRAAGEAAGKRCVHVAVSPCQAHSSPRKPVLFPPAKRRLSLRTLSNTSVCVLRAGGEVVTTRCVHVVPSHVHVSPSRPLLPVRPPNRSTSRRMAS